MRYDSSSTDPNDVADEARALVMRVERGELARDALELLSAVGDVASRRALGQLELVLTRDSTPLSLEELPASYPDAWLEWASHVEPLGRRVAVAAACAIARGVLPALETEESISRSQLVGLHTGPAGAILLTDELASHLFPLIDVAGRALDAVAGWLARPSASSAERVDDAWPALLCSRKAVELFAELESVPWPAVWTFRWLVATVLAPEREIAASLGYVATYAHVVHADRAVVARVACDALRAELIARP